jgi:hypothetical protein
MGLGSSFYYLKMKFQMERAPSGKSLSAFHAQSSIENFLRDLTPRILEPLNPLGNGFTRLHNYLSPYSFTYQPTILEMIQYD